ncbi:MAG: nicotinamide-nucleotide amidohydrolase family protein [Bacteriovoracaceae bacterium]|nr:nicotinamide-nucleotide amidohydrolase family protein [Bacteriovoracaceae bacterium]
MSKELKVELIIIGDEILNGRVSDLNGPFLAQTLFKKGLLLNNITICGDSYKEIENTINHSINRSQLIFITGGLGPTEDDKTKQCLAKIFNKKLIASEAGEKVTKENYSRYGKEWILGQNNYNFIPEDFVPQQNFNGLAPGLIYTIKEKGKVQKLLIAPGVPREFQIMLEKVFLPELINEKICPDLAKKQVVIKTQGIPEEQIFTEAYPSLWNDFSVYGKVSSLPQISGVNIIVSLFDDIHYENALKAMQALVAETQLNEHVWQYGDLSLPELIVKKCTEKSITFSFSESCTGGLSSSKITNVPGSSSVFEGGFITYSNNLKTKYLNVKDETLKAYGAVSEQTALEMAEGTLKSLNTDIAISWSGIAGPGGGTLERPIGTLALGWACKNGISGSNIQQSNGTRFQLKNRFSEIGLRKLLSIIEVI